MNHEFWNEIGNLYFMNGAYEPAIHAYLRSIESENTFGRSYSNLAMAYVQTHRYNEAIQLYRHSIELLSDSKEKAVTWNRLGILYRQIKDYDKALEAYQRADSIMPKITGEDSNINLPLTISMPQIDLNMVFAKDDLENPQPDALAEINAMLESAESNEDDLLFEDMLNAPEFENYSQLEETSCEPPHNTHSDWKFEYTDSILLDEKSEPVELEDVKLIIPSDMPNEETAEFEQPNSQLNFKAQPDKENIVTESIQYIQANEMFADLSAEEQKSLELEIIKCQQAVNKNPRSYILLEALGEAFKSAGQYKDAILAFQKAIVLNPANYMCHYRLGLVYAAEQKEEEAIRSFQKVLELDPNSAQAHASLASQYRKMGLEEIAQQHIEKARAMQFENESDYNHACLEAICGNHERALELLDAALQSKQTYVKWAQDDPDFDTLRSDHRFQILLSAHASAS